MSQPGAMIMAHPPMPMTDDPLPSSFGGPGAASSLGVRDYLVRFGYLDPEVQSAGAVAKALWGFQRLHRLPLTGVPDVMTLGVMHLPRCGNPDLGKPAPIPHIWSVTELICETANAPASMTLKEVQQACSLAAACWQPHLPFGVRVGRGGSETSVTIRFVVGDHGDGCAVGGDWGVLGHAFILPGRGGRLIGEIHLDARVKWSLTTEGEAGAFSLVTELSHQLGHIFGLGHSMTTGTAMYPVHRWMRSTPARQDLVALRALREAPTSLWQRLRYRLRLG
jgi:hypothetical protein